MVAPRKHDNWASEYDTTTHLQRTYVYRHLLCSSKRLGYGHWEVLPSVQVCSAAFALSPAFVPAQVLPITAASCGVSSNSRNHAAKYASWDI